MAQFPTITLTNAGLNMIAQAQAGEKLIFTKAKMGDGQIVGQNISTLVDLISPKLVLPLSSCESQGTGQVKLRFTATNETVEAGFFARELGVYAKIGDGGVEQLYAYTNAGNFSDYVPDKNTPLEAQTVNMYVIVGNAQNVAILVDKTVVYITLADMDDHDNNPNAHPDAVDKHSSDANAHTVAFEKHNNHIDAHSLAFNYWQKARTYALGDIIYPKLHGNPFCFECTQQGVSGNSEPIWVYSDDAIVNDNTCIWKVCLRSAGSGLNLLKRNTSYQVGDIAYSKNLPSWARLECVKAGTTANVEPQWTNIHGGG